MIKSIRHKGLRLLWEEDNGSKLPADQVMRIKFMLEVVDSIEEMPADLIVYKNWNVHKLTGNLNEFWSLKVNKNFRVIFKFDGRNAYDVDYIDYH